MDSNNDKIAVIGMAGRFPGAQNIETFWANLLDGKESITYFSDEELAKHNPDFEEKKNDPNYIKARGIIDDIDKFDADFFGYKPMEARIMDPQHRIWLETAWNALENAGCDPDRYKGSIGVFVGCLYNTYLLNNVIREQESLEKYLHIYDIDSFQIMINNDSSFLPTKTAYKFNLKGPAINVQSACSTSLVAIAQACQSLFSFESDTCIAGGISLYVPQESGYSYQKGAITSPDGHCRPFDIDSNGTVASNGVGAVVLKRLDDALADKDHIYAVVKGWAINNDGNKKVSYMAPSVDGQADVIMMAQEIADVHPEEISYIETHGTATPLGDPIEIAALTKAFRSKTDKTQFCAIGSVKSNIGHLDTTAGVTGFIKTCLAANHRLIPPSINFKNPNPNIEFSRTPFYVIDKTKIWDSENPLIMGVSSFGIGGTNAHVIIQEPDVYSKSNHIPDRPQLIVLSAKSEAALGRRKDDLVNFFKTNPDLSLPDVAYTLQVGRSRMSYRSFGVIESKEDLLKNRINECFIDSVYKNESWLLAFMFPGQGAQYLKMGHDLYKKEPLCTKIYDQCFKIFERETNISLKNILFNSSQDEEANIILSRTEYTQPALFITEYVVAKYLESFGIKPNALIGHSIGEYAAACLAGIFELEDALKIVIKRGQLMQKMPNGYMMVAKCGEEKLKAIMNNTFEIAASNAPGYCTISFKTENKEAVNQILTENQIEFINLNTSHAFHSAAFDPILDEFSNFVDQFNLKSPQIPVISCLTGDFADAEFVKTGKYWASQLRNTVLFDKGVNTIIQTSNYVFLEVGPNTHLTSLAKRSTENKSKCPIISTLGKPENTNEQVKMMQTIGLLWAKGIDPNFTSLHHPHEPKKVVLPSYPFERKSYWIEKTNFKGFNHSTTNSQTTDSFEDDQLKTKNGDLQSEEQPDTMAILKKMLCNLSGIDPIEVKPTISFSFLGLESLFLAQFAQAIEKRFKVSIKFRQLMQEYPNLELLTSHIDKNTQQKNTKEITNPPSLKTGGNMVVLKPEGRNIPFIMVFGDICNTYLPKMINQDHPYWGFMHSGSDGETIDFDSIEKMAASYVDELIAIKPNGPYLIGGYSFGGIVAFEMAIQLQNKGLDVPLLIMVDSLNPLKKRLRFSFEGANYILKTLIKKVVYSHAKGKRQSMSIDYRNAYIMGVYASLWKKYKPTKFCGNLTLFKSSENRSKFKFLGWDEHCSTVDLIELKGNHMDIIRKSKNVEKMVSHINQELQKAQLIFNNAN